MKHELYRRILMIESLHRELRSIAPTVQKGAVEATRARIGYWMDTDDKDPLDGA